MGRAHMGHDAHRAPNRDAVHGNRGDAHGHVPPRGVTGRGVQAHRSVPGRPASFEHGAAARAAHPGRPAGRSERAGGGRPVTSVAESAEASRWRQVELAPMNVAELAAVNAAESRWRSWRSSRSERAPVTRGGVAVERAPVTIAAELAVVAHAAARVPAVVDRVTAGVARAPAWWTGW